MVRVVGEFLCKFLRLSFPPVAGGGVGSIPWTVGGDLRVRVVRSNLGKLQRYSKVEFEC